MSKYIVVVDYYDSWKFFSKILDSARKDVIFVTNLPSVYVAAKVNGWNAKLYWKSNNSFEFNISKSREYLSTDISHRGAIKYCTSLYTELSFLIKGDGSSQTILTWNGSDLKGSVIRRLKIERCFLNTRYFELSNFPNYVFCDSEGVNGESQPAKNGSVIKNHHLVFDTTYYEKKVALMIDSKVDYIPPQSTLSKKISPRHFIDYLWCVLLGTSNYDLKAMRKIALNKIKSKKSDFMGAINERNEILMLDCSYAFFPFQVSSDSQVLAHYDGNLVDALYEAIKIANNRQKKLVVKTHPAEKDYSIVSRLVNICSENNVLVLSSPVSEILKQTDLLITINSTVGLEAALNDIEVVFLGESQFSNLDNINDFYKYMELFLCEIDFFKPRILSAEELNKVLKLP